MALTGVRWAAGLTLGWVWYRGPLLFWVLNRTTACAWDVATWGVGVGAGGGVAWWLRAGEAGCQRGKWRWMQQPCVASLGC